jgi:hypothetical protein
MATLTNAIKTYKKLLISSIIKGVSFKQYLLRSTD